MKVLLTESFTSQVEVLFSATGMTRSSGAPSLGLLFTLRFKSLNLNKPCKVSLFMSRSEMWQICMTLPESRPLTG